MAGNAKYESGLALRQKLDDLTPFGWRFVGLENTGGECFAYRYENIDDSEGGYILVTGDDVLSADGSADDFGNRVMVSQYIYDERMPDDGVTSWEWRAMAWAVSDDLDTKIPTESDIAEAVRSVFVRWRWERWGVWDGFGFDCEDPDNIQQHECTLVGVYPSEEIAIGEADRHYEALIANNPEWQSFFVLVRSSDEWEVR